MCSIIIRLFLINLNVYKHATKFLKYLYFFKWLTCPTTENKKKSGITGCKPMTHSITNWWWWCAAAAAAA